MISIKPRGFYTMYVNNRKVAEFENLVTDAGMRGFFERGSFLMHCRVGKGSTEPSYLDTQLQVPVATTSTTATPVSPSGLPEFGRRRRVGDGWVDEIERAFAFSIGSVVGTISEVCVGQFSTTSPYYNQQFMFSRALVRDLDGAPVSITVAADEQLIVVYRYEHHVPAVDVSGISMSFGDITRTARIRSLRPHFGTSYADFMSFTYGSVARGSVSVGLRSLVATYQSSRSFGAFRGGVLTPEQLTQWLAGSPQGNTVNNLPTVTRRPNIPGAVVDRFSVTHRAQDGEIVIGGVVIGVRLDPGVHTDDARHAALILSFDEPIVKTADQEFRLEVDITTRWRDPD